MGLIVFIIFLCIFVIILLGVKGDEWFNHAPSHSKARDVFIYNEDGEIVDMYRDKTGLPNSVILEDDDIRDEIGDDADF